MKFQNILFEECSILKQVRLSDKSNKPSEVRREVSDRS